MGEEIKEGDWIRWRESVGWQRGRVDKVEHDSYGVRLEDGGWTVTPKGEIVQKVEPPEGEE